MPADRLNRPTSAPKTVVLHYRHATWMVLSSEVQTARAGPGPSAADADLAELVARSASISTNRIAGYTVVELDGHTVAMRRAATVQAANLALDAFYRLPSQLPDCPDVRWTRGWVVRKGEISRDALPGLTVWLGVPLSGDREPRYED